MTRMTFGIALCTLAFVQLEAHALSATSALAKTAGGDDAWIASIRRDHPRMFFNADTWPSIKARTLSEPKVRAQYEKLLRDCDCYPAKPVCIPQSRSVRTSAPWTRRHPLQSPT